jgi:hypothetical protein
LAWAPTCSDWCGASPADPVVLEGMQERFLPECSFRGRDKRKLQFAVLADDFWHTRCSQRLPTSAPPRIEPVCLCARYAKN